MQHICELSTHTLTDAMIISLLAALCGMLLTGVQILLIHLQGSGICLNQGCEIVDSLTTVDPLYFNIAGFLFFFIASIAISKARKGSEPARYFASLLLLAALAAEAVLYSFQLFISQIFCSYCLIVLALIVVANLFMGIKQLFKGAVIFSAVFVAFASLDFAFRPDEGHSLENGTMARYEAPQSVDELYLFFSSTCTYCEGVVDTLKTATNCTVNFNPIDPIDSFTFPKAAASPGYRPEINRDFLKILGIEEVPVLLSRKKGAITVTKGSQAIKTYLERTCVPDMRDRTTTGMMEQSNSEPLPIPDLDDSCSVEENCDETKSLPDSSQ